MQRKGEFGLISIGCGRLFGVVVFVSCYAGMSPDVLSAQASRCQHLFRGGKFLAAAHCYEEQIRGFSALAGSDGLEQIRLDRLLRHGAFSYIKAISGASSIGQKGYLRQRAIILLMRSFRGGSCQPTNRCRAHRLLADQLAAQIQYTPLIVLTGDPKARIVILGYRYKSEHTERLQLTLRPGQYTVKVYFPRQAQPQIKRVQLLPTQTLTLNVTPYQIKVVTKKIIVARQIPRWVWIGYVAGTAMFAVGTVLVIYGAVEQERLNAILIDPDANQTLTDKQYHGSFDAAQGAKATGLILGGAGLAMLLAGVVIHVMVSKQQPKAPSPRVASRQITSRAVAAKVVTLLETP